MNVQSTYKGRTYTEVTVTLAEDRMVNDDVIAGWAMAQVNLTPSNLFGWSVSRPADYPLMAVVTLNTD